MSGQIPRHFIDELMTRVDIVDIIDNYVQLKKAGKNFTACCPFHNEKTPSFIVFQDTQNYHCFGCQAHGNVISFLINYAHLDFVSAIQELATHAGVDVIYEENTALAETTVQKANYYDIMATVSVYFQTQLQKPENQLARDYLKARGLQADTINTFGLGYAPDNWQNLLRAFGDTSEKRTQLVEMGLIIEDKPGHFHDRFRQRIMFPIHDRRGKVIAFGGRVLDDSKPKYLNSPETPLFQKSRELYGWHWLRKKVEEQVLVVEGYMDVVMLAQYGIRNAVATLGTAVAQTHLKQLFHNFAEVIFCFDADEAGAHAAWRALETSLPHLRDSCTVSFMFFPEGEDPDSYVRKLGTELFKQQLKERLFLSRYLFDQLEKKGDLRSIEGRAGLVELAKPLLKQLPAGHYRHLLWQMLSERSGIDVRKFAVPYRNNQQKQQENMTGSLNPVPKMIRFLLYKPTLAQQVQDTQGLTAIKEPAMNLLVELLEFIKNYPTVEKLTAAIICQHWTEKAEAGYLNELAGQEILLPEEEMTREFAALLELLYRSRNDSENEQRLSRLWQKEELTEDEKQELKMLSEVKFRRC